MTEYLILITFSLTALATIARLSWSSGPGAVAAVAVAFACLPPLAEGTIAGLSQGRVGAWLRQPEAGKSLSLLLVAEGIISGALAFRVLRRCASQKLRLAMAVIPSPGLVLGLLGVQMIAFNRIDGLEFSTMAWGLSIGMASLIGGGAWFVRRAFPMERRAEMVVRLAAAQFVLGAALPLLLRPPQSQPGVGKIDLAATILAPVGMLGVVALGVAWRAIRLTLRHMKSNPKSDRRRLA